MPFTQTDLDAINAALASGELSIRSSDGKQVTYRTVDELIRAKRVVEAELAAAATPTLRPYPRYQVADFSDC